MDGLGIVLSVGLSLRENFVKWLDQHGRSVADHLVEMESRGPAFRGYMADFEANLASHHPGGLDYPCAELQTLAIFLAQNPSLRQSRKRLTLFHVQGREGKACAGTLRWLLGQEKAATLILGGPAEVCLEEFALSLEDEGAFAENVADLLASIRERARHYRSGDCRRVLVAITGGYKVLTPFLALLGFLDGEEVLYGYETSSSVLTIPQLPVAWDLRFLDEFRACFSAEEISSAAYRTLPPKVQRFFLAQPRGGVHLKSPFGRTLTRDYQERRHLRFGYGEPLLARFTDQARRGKLEQLIQGKWDYLWLGDQIPETVEHTRGHSARLMELARDLLDLTGVTLPDHELFALVAAIWLHDTGHSALQGDRLLVNGRSFPLSLFPSLVRDLAPRPLGRAGRAARGRQRGGA